MTDHHEETTQYLPGVKPVLELLTRQPERVDHVFVRKGRRGDSDKILDLCRQAKVRFSLVGDEDIARLLKGPGGGGHQGVVARLREAARMDWRELLENAPHAPLPLILALDQVQDPGNVGTLARSLYAMGGAGLVLPRHNSAFLGPGALRSSAGALEYLPVAEVVNLSRAVEEAAEAGFTTYSTQGGAGGLNALSCPLNLPALLVLGNEDKGVRPGVAKHCEFGLTIPFLRDFDSLNVAQAGGILVSCFLRATFRS